MKRSRQTHAAVALFLGASLLGGQLAGAQQPPAPAASPQAPQGEAPKTESPAKVTAEELEKVSAGERAKMLLGYLSKRERRADFFGLAMDPTKPLAARKVEKVAEPSKPTEIDPSLLQEAVQRIQVTGVLPKRQQAIIGARVAEVGTRIDVRQGEVVFKLRISSISADGVMLQDMETGEIVRAGQLRGGLAPGISTSQQANGAAPGIVPMGGNGIVIP